MKEPASIFRTAFVSTSLQSRLRFIIWEGTISRGMAVVVSVQAIVGRNAVQREGAGAGL